MDCEVEDNFDVQEISTGLALFLESPSYAHELGESLVHCESDHLAVVTGSGAGTDARFFASDLVNARER
jgi:hypothetical protein